MSKTSFALAAAVAVAALTGGISAANAGGKHMQMHMHNNVHNNFFHHHRRFGLIIANTGVGCGYLYDRWLATGDYYWKRKFYVCRRGW